LAALTGEYESFHVVPILLVNIVKVFIAG
jgi:hypothetical protein